MRSWPLSVILTMKGAQHARGHWQNRRIETANLFQVSRGVDVRGNDNLSAERYCSGEHMQTQCVCQGGYRQKSRRSVSIEHLSTNKARVPGEADEWPDNEFRQAGGSGRGLNHERISEA